MEKEHRLKVAGGRILACLESGDPAGAPVFYLHGYPGSRLESRLLSPAAAQSRIRLLAIDRPGFGESTHLPGREILDTAADLRQLADHLYLRDFALLGVSGGGPHALACAVRMPSRVNSVALIGGVAPPTPALTVGMIAPYRWALSMSRRLPRTTRLLVASIASLLRRNPERFLATFQARACPADREVLAQPHIRELMFTSMLAALSQGGFHVAHELGLLARPWGFRIADVSTRVRQWQGMADNIVPPAMARFVADQLPRGALHCLRDEGHLSILVRHSRRVLADLTHAAREKRA